METLPSAIRDCYSKLCQALREEYSLSTDQVSATPCVFAIMQEKLEPLSNSIQATQNIKAPPNVSELSLLGACDDSQQLVTDDAEIARPPTELHHKDKPFEWREPEEQPSQLMEEKLSSAPCLVHPDKDREFNLEASSPPQCPSAALTQNHDTDKQVITYASRPLSSVEIKFSDCEKALLPTVCAVEHFHSSTLGQKVIMETCHQPVTVLNSQSLREGRMPNSRIASQKMALQGYDIEVRYAQNHKMALGLDLAECQHRNREEQPSFSPLPAITPSLPSNHGCHDENLCQNRPKSFVDGWSFHHASQLQTGVGMVCVDRSIHQPNHHQSGPKTSQYAEVAAVLIAPQQAARVAIVQLAICSDSSYARYSLVSHFPMWKANGMKNARNQVVKHSELLLACDRLVVDRSMTIYLGKVKGHSQSSGPDKDGNDEANRLAKLGAEQGTPWEFQTDWLPAPQKRDVNAITRRQATEQRENPQTSGQTLHLGQKPGDADLVTMQEQNPAIQTIRQVVANLPSQGTSPVTPDETKEVQALHQTSPHLRSEKGLLVHSHNGQEPTRWVVSINHKGVMLGHTHNSPVDGHHDYRANLQTLQQATCWPPMTSDTKPNVQGCLTSRQSQPTQPLNQAPPQGRGVAFQWSNLQVNWTGPVPKSSRGSRYLLKVTCTFTKCMECLPAPKATAVTTALFKHESQCSSYMVNPSSLVALRLLLSGWVITASVAHMMYKVYPEAAG
ncbi:protein NYNRIN-like [Trachinotus anak]|uniref:protein NYNRIN-like n=1 Tax=Trachinotus anak TaxID=443729 RepID=UPI0039F2381D